MTNERRVARFALACALAIGTGAPPAAAQSLPARDARVWPGTPLIYALEYDESGRDERETVRLFYALTGVPVRPIFKTTFSTAPISSLAVAPGGDLSIAVEGRKTQTIFVFHAGASTPYQTIDLGPSDASWSKLAIAPTGTMAVTMGSAIRLYEPGAGVPINTIETPLHSVSSVAYGADGTLWCAGYTTGEDAFAYIRPGDTQFTPVPIPFTMVGPILIDGAGNVVVGARGRLWAYTPLGTLVYTVPLFGRPADIGVISLGPDGRRVYVGAYGRQIEAYNFPAGGRPLLEIGRLTGGFAIGRTLR